MLVLFGTNQAARRSSTGGCSRSPGTRPTRPGRSVMIWIQVRDVHAGHARLAAAGVPVVREPVAEPRGLIEVWVEDPDGIRIVLAEVPADHPLRRDPRSALPPERRTSCRITARSTAGRRPSARPVGGADG
jgi:hypothetical protein